MITKEHELPVLRGTDIVAAPGEVVYLDISPPPYCNAACVGCYAGAGSLIREELRKRERELLTPGNYLAIVNSVKF